MEIDVVTDDDVSIGITNQEVVSSISRSAALRASVMRTSAPCSARNWFTRRRNARRPLLWIFGMGRQPGEASAAHVAARLVRAAKRWSPRAKPLSAPTESSRSSGLRHVLQTKYEIAGKGAAVYQLMGLSAGWSRPSVSGPPEFVRAAPHTGATTW